jgi:GT2 family glycosyltransferase
MKTKYPLISIITVNYNGLIYTRDFLNSLQHISYPNIEIFVVDNASSEPIKELKESFPSVNFIESNENLGFAGGNNLAIQQAKGEYCFLLNNDTEVAPDFLEPIVNLMEMNPLIGVCSSKLVYYDNPSILQFAGSGGINPYTGRGFAIGYNETDRTAFNESYKTELAHGAAMLIRKSTLAKTGLMAELFFLYYEETDFCERVKKAGFEIWYCGASKVLHKESMSVGKDSPLKTYYLTRNRIIYTRRNTTGMQKIAALSFFYLISFPKGILKFVAQGDIKLLHSFIKGACWNLINHNIYANTGFVAK